MMQAVARIAICAVLTVLILGLGILAFASSIHNPSWVLDMIQWIALPLFQVVVTLGLYHSNALCLVGALVSGVLWFGILFKTLPPFNRFIGGGSGAVQ